MFCAKRRSHCVLWSMACLTLFTFLMLWCRRSPHDDGAPFEKAFSIAFAPSAKRTPTPTPTRKPTSKTVVLSTSIIVSAHAHWRAARARARAWVVVRATSRGDVSFFQAKRAS